MLSNLAELKLPQLPHSNAFGLALHKDTPGLTRLGIRHYSLIGSSAAAVLTALRTHAQDNCVNPASTHGFDLKTDSSQVGSLRARSFNTALAGLLYKVLSCQMPKYIIDEFPDCRADLDGHGHWEFVGINPLFRFIRYPSQTGVLVAHYDAPYVASPDTRTLYSLLVYLSDCEKGATRFLLDPQSDLSEEKRIFQDWSRVGHADEVCASIPCKFGDVIIFPHRLLHDSEPNSTEKIVMRSDLVFKKVLSV